VAGTGDATITSGLGADVFRFVNTQAGGSDLILNFDSSDKIQLTGYGKAAIANALASQVTVGNSTSITLADNTKVTFSGVNSLTNTQFF
jgi:hypothetical protein